jgi:negative regulator of flagellin synthesis FlgM
VSKTPAAEETQARNRPQQAGDAVDFSDTVTNLQRIEVQLKQTPEVDAERVADVRARIESGEYEVDAQSVASKLARLEQDLS